MNSMQEIAKLWPVLDEYHREGLRDFFARWTSSWVNFSGTMGPTQKQEQLRLLDQELLRRALALQDVYGASSPSDNSSISLPPEMQQLQAVLPS